MSMLRCLWLLSSIVIIQIHFIGAIVNKIELTDVISIADFPLDINVEYLQTAYHFSRAKTKPSFTCSNGTAENKYSQNHLLASMQMNNCTCTSSTPLGSAAYADWSILLPCLFRYSVSAVPRIIYVQTAMLPFFIQQVLPIIPTGPPFVLISGGTDFTIPRQIDTRYIQLDGFENEKLFLQLLNSSRLLHWYAENRDVSTGYDKFSTWPTGLSFAKKRYPDDMSDLIAIRRELGYTNLKKKSLKVLVSDRLHGYSSQMHLRREVRALCNRTPTCQAPDTEEDVPHTQFLEDISKVSFVACIQGGGIDPSPKAWEAILAGSIPIIKSSWLDDAYRQLPVVLVEEWDQVFFPEVLVDRLYPSYFERINNGSLNMLPSTEQAVDVSLYEEAKKVYEARLEQWRRELWPYYKAQSTKRHEVLRRLQSAYWMNQVYEKLDRYDATQGNVSESHRTVRRARWRPVVEEGVEAPVDSSHKADDSSTSAVYARKQYPVHIALYASVIRYPVFGANNTEMSTGATSKVVTSTFKRLSGHISSLSNNETLSMTPEELREYQGKVAAKKKVKSPKSDANNASAEASGIYGNATVDGNLRKRVIVRNETAILEKRNTNKLLRKSPVGSNSTATAGTTTAIPKTADHQQNSPLANQDIKPTTGTAITTISTGAATDGATIDSPLNKSTKKRTSFFSFW